MEFNCFCSFEAMKITLYEPWMLPQVIDMFVNQYEVNFEEFKQLFLNFYEHDYQKDKNIRIVALEGETVIGFQSFFYWPYIKDGVQYNSYQSGNSLVHPDHRGKSIFKKLLLYFDEIKADFGVDFLLGFPIQASKNSFIRLDWSNVLDLVWYVKIGSIFSIFQGKPDKENEVQSRLDNSKIAPNNLFSLSQSSDFINWRKCLPKSDEKFTITFKQNEKIAVYECKLQTRKKIISECVVGGITSNSDDLAFHKQGIKYLVKTIRRKRLGLFISIAINEHVKSSILESLLHNSFKKTSKKIYFIVKNYSDSKDTLDASKWLLYRRDIDTW